MKVMKPQRLGIMHRVVKYQQCYTLTVIAGVVPNAVTPSPIVQDNHTQNVIRTGGNNSIVLDDEGDKQWLQIHTPSENTFAYMGTPLVHRMGGAIFGSGKVGDYDGPAPADELLDMEDFTSSLSLHTEGSGVLEIGGSWVTSVGGFKGENVVGTVSEFYNASHFSFVGGSRVERVSSSTVESYESGQDTYVSGGPLKVDVTGDGFYHITGSEKRDIDTDWTLKTPTATINSEATAINATTEGNLNFAKADLKFGPTTLDWGSTTGKIAKLALKIPGGATIETPNWEVVNPTSIWQSSYHEVSIGNKVSFVAQDISAAAFKSENSIIELSVSVYDNEKTALKLQTYAQKKLTAANNILTNALYSSIGAIHSLL